MKIRYHLEEHKDTANADDTAGNLDDEDKKGGGNAKEVTQGKKDVANTEHGLY